MKFEQITTLCAARLYISDWWFYHKGSEIWANHNTQPYNGESKTIGDSTTKVVKFEQITTIEFLGDMMDYWWFYHKGSEIWANHNQNKFNNNYIELVILPQR